jgi:sugar lactone lactonase YvrE
MSSPLLSRRAFLEAAAASSAAVAVGAASAPAQAAPGVPPDSPVTPRADLSRVTSVAIHPAVGFARVGNSREAFYFGPEVPGSASRGPFKDADGAMAKQAARFRIFGYDAQGRVVGEVTAADADITWRVDVANTKPFWYDPAEAFDVPNPPDTRQRNPKVTDRTALVTRATPRTVQGAGAKPQPLDGGTFLDLPVDLGEVFTDGSGRLVVMPADGRAIPGPDAPPLTGLSSDGWTDDTCDGPVRATVRLGGRTLDATPAYVVCTSPDWGPSVAEGIITLHDAVESALYTAKRFTKPRTDFARDVYPIFRRLTDTQWVNEGFLHTNGWGTPGDWTTPAMRRKLADRSKANRAWRRKVFASFRNPTYSQMEPDLIPALYGDKIAVLPNLVQPRQWMALTPLQYAHLRAWAEGRFTVTDDPEPTRLSDIPLGQRPAALDHAALGACLGGAFHPGIEFTWLARIPWIWTRDKRLKWTSLEPNTTDYGPLMTRENALSRSGPLSDIGPGSIGQWMGLPWHSDSASCRSGYTKAISPVSPTFWPARIPNQVLAEADYDVVMDSSRSLADRRAAFARRRGWERFIAAPTYQPTINAMINDWYKLGVVTEMPGPRDGFFPTTMKVETGVGFEREPAFDYGAFFAVPQLPTFPIAVGCSDDNSVRLITARGDESQFWVDKPLARPEGMARDSAGNLYVACMDDGTIARISPRGYVTTYATGLGSPIGLYMGKGNLLYVTDYSDDGSVSVITGEGAVTALVPPGSGLRRPVGITMNPVDGTLLVGSSTDGTIWQIDPADGTVRDKAWIAGIPGPLLMTVDLMQHLWVCTGGTTSAPLYRFDATGGRLPLQLEGVDIHGVMGVAYDSRNRMYVTNPLRNLIARITMSGDVGTVEAFAYGGPNPGGIVFNG